MPIHAGWFLEERITYYDYRGDVSIEELESAIEISIDLMEQCKAPLLHSIQTYDSMVTFPQNATKLVLATKTLMEMPGLGWIVFVGIKNPIIKSLAGFVSGVLRIRYRLYDTMEEALEFLNYVDSTLPPLTTDDVPKREDLPYYIDSARDSVN
jgi:hypothetical protein